MREPKNTTRNRPLSIKGLTFEEAVSKILIHKPSKEEKPKKTKEVKTTKTKH